jgi:hypothetical protein
MSNSIAESAILIGLMLLSSSEICIAIHSANASKASTPFDSQGSIVEPPERARIHIYVYKGFAESAVLIALKVLSIK